MKSDKMNSIDSFQEMVSKIHIQQTGRMEYIDIAKGLGMILVVIGHCINAKVFPGIWIYSFHMPLFFILSGICFNEKKYPIFLPFLKKRVQTLLLPCLYFSVVISILSAILLTDYSFTRWFYGFSPGLWFVFVLFISELIYWFVNCISSKLIKCILLIISFAIGYLLSQWQVSLPYNLCSVFAATFFYGLGHLLKNRLRLLVHISYVHNLFIASILLLIPGVVVSFTGTYIGMADNIIPDPALLYCLIAIMGALGILIFSTFKYGKLKKILLFIGNNTLTILATHIFFIGLSSQYMLPLIDNYLFYKIIEQIIVWTSVVICCYIINNKASWMIGKSYLK